MSEPFDPLTVPVRPAATVMLVRDHPLNGLEVFMLQRTMSAVFAKGMYVFPVGESTLQTTRQSCSRCVMTSATIGRARSSG